MSTNPNGRSHARECALFALVGALALALNAVVFPMAVIPDSGGYLSPARRILDVIRDDALAFTDIDTRFRMLGYPALLAGLEGLFGTYLYPALYVVQAACVLLSGVMLFALLRRLRASPFWAALLAGLYLLAWPRHLAGFMLTDAVHNAVTAIAVCLLIEPLFREMRISWRRVLAAGVLIAFAFLLRESNRYALVCFLPILAVLAWKLAMEQRRTVAALLLIPVFALPTLATIEAYKTLNQARFGERFVTTAGRTAMLQPLMPVGLHNPTLFDGESPFDAKAREVFKAYNFPEILAFNSHWLEQGVPEGQLSDWAFAKYFEAWRRFPLAMIDGIRARFKSDKQASELLNPPGSVYITERWHRPGQPSETARRKAAWQSGDVAKIVTWQLAWAGRIPSVLIFVLFAIGTPVAAVMAWRRNESTLALGFLALLATYIGYCLLFSLVHLTMRYLGGIAVILPIAASLSVLTIRRYRFGGGKR